MKNKMIAEDFEKIKRLYDVGMSHNDVIHDLIFPLVYGKTEYIGQFSDNSVSELRELGHAMGLSSEAKVLDIGCGRGAVAAFMAKNFNWNVTGIDLAKTPLNYAKHSTYTQYSIPQVMLIHGNVYSHNFNHLFDGIYGTGAVCHFNADNLFKRCNELLRDDGILAFMERIRIGNISKENWCHLTEEWHCPYVYTIEEYIYLLEENGFELVQANDLTEKFKVWQAKSVLVREQLKNEIIRSSSSDYYEFSLKLARHENNVTQSGSLGYTSIVSKKKREIL